MEIDLKLLDCLPKEKRLEIAANVCHKPFTVSEMVRAAEEIERYIREDAKKRQAHGGPRSGNLPERSKGQTRDIVANALGISGRSLEKAKAVVLAADENPAFKPLVEEMDRTRNVQRMFVEVSRLKKLAARKKLAQDFQESDNEKIKLFCGDFRKVDVADNSIDFIFTDPPYLKEFIPIYRDLGIFTKRVLKEGGSLLCFAGHYALPEIMDLLGESLRWHWLIVVHHTGSHRQLDGARIQVHYKPILWFTKGAVRTDRDYVADHVDSGKPEKIDHPWEQSVVEADYYIQHLTLPGEIVCDPFLESGTTGEAAVKCNRFFIGSEINEEHFKLAQMRIYSAQRPNGQLDNVAL